MQMFVELAVYSLLFFVVSIVLIYISCLMDKLEDKKWDEELRKEGDSYESNGRNFHG